MATDSKHWLRVARGIARNHNGGAAALFELRDHIAERLDSGESISDVVTAWDSLSRSPNDTEAARILFLALDGATAQIRMNDGIAVALGIVFTFQFRDDCSFQLTDAIPMARDTVDFVTGIVFEGSSGKPKFATDLLQHLQIEIAMLTPNRLGRHTRAATKNAHQIGPVVNPCCVVPPYPNGVLHIVNSKPNPEKPYSIFTGVLPGYLWFEATAGREEIPKVWLHSGQLRDHYDFSVLDKVCARVQSDVQAQFAGIISTKMNPVPMRLMSAGEILSTRSPDTRSQQRAQLRALGHY